MAWASSRRVMLVMMSLPTLYNYLYSMTVSGAYTLSPVFGGALFMSGAAASAYAQTYLGERRKSLTKRMRVLGTLLLALYVFADADAVGCLPGVLPRVAFLGAVRGDPGAHRARRVRAADDWQRAARAHRQNRVQLCSLPCCSCCWPG